MRPTGNMISTIHHVEKEQARRRALLTRYPDISEVHGEYYARSATSDAKDIFVEDGVLVVYARVKDDGTGLADADELPVHVRAGGLPIVDLFQVLREKHPEAWKTVLAIVSAGDIFSGKDDIPW